MRALTSREIGIQDPENAGAGRRRPRRPRADRRRPHRVGASGSRTALSTEHTVDIEIDPNEALFHAAEGNYDLVIVSLALKNYDALRLCSQLRSLDRTRNVPILAICDGEDNARMIRGLEIGVNDYLMRPVDKNELHARARTQIRKKRYTERLRDNVQQSIEMAITDGLTGLYNRRYMESHLGALVEQAARARQAADRARARHRLLQVGQRHLRPRRRRRRAARVRHPHQEVDPRHRSRLPPRRRGVRHRHAGDRHGGRHHRRRAAAPAHRLGAVRDRAGDRSTSRSRSRSGLPRSTPSTTTPPRSSSAPTRRSIAPSATAATASSPTRRSDHPVSEMFSAGCGARR